MKKFLSLLIAVAMLLSVACVANAEDEIPEITWMISVGNEMPNDDASVVKELSARTGIKVKPIFVGNTDYGTKLSGYITGDDLPDIFYADALTAKDLVAHGKVLDMSEYLEEYGQNILADGEAKFSFGINAGDAIYGIPGIPNKPWSMAVRRDWMQNLGYDIDNDVDIIEMTISDFANLMYEFTHNDPDQDGVDDTFGFCAEDSSFGMYAPYFTAYGLPMNGWDSMYFDEETQTCKSIFKHPNTMKVMELMNWFYQNGCMDQEFTVVATSSTEFAFLWNSTAGAASWAPAGMTNNWLSRYTEEGVTDRSFIYVNITDDEGNGGGYVVTYPGSMTMISSACKDPEAAIKLLDYCCTEEGQLLTYLGIEGVHYTWEDRDNYVSVATEAFADAAAQRTDGGFVIFNNFAPDNNIQNKTLTKITQNIIQYGYEHPMTNSAIIYETPEIAAELGSTLSDLWLEMFVMMTTAEEGADLQAIYDEYVARYDSDAYKGLVYEEQYTDLYLGK